MSRGRKNSRRVTASDATQPHATQEIRSRVKALTERLLFEFIAMALEAISPVPGDPLIPAQYQAVAAAAMNIAILMNAPTGFLDFMLRIPWDELGTVLPRGLQGVPVRLHSDVSAKQRAVLVNTPLPSSLLECVLSFLYDPAHSDCLPPLLQGSVPSRRGTVELVASLLDGATPLHCAALRGNSAQVDYLLWCGADPLLRTAAGELALELVPKCTFKPSRGLFGWRPSSTCDCGSDEEGGDPGDCGKHAVRALLARSCLVTFHAGLVSWVKLALLCLLAMLGLWGCHGSLDRLSLERHHDRRALMQRADARARLKGVAYRLKHHLVQGRALLAALAWHQQPPLPPSDFGRSPGGGAKATNGHWDPGTRPGSQSESESGDDDSDASEEDAINRANRALAAFEMALTLLKVLAAKGVCPPVGPSVPSGAPGPALTPAMREAEWYASAEDMASVFSGLAEAALAKFGACICNGCAACARDAIQRAHGHAAYCIIALNTRKRLAGTGASNQPHSHQGANKSKAGVEASDAWGIGTEGLARVVAVHVRLLLKTDAAVSPTLANVAAAQGCLQEWRSVGAAAPKGTWAQEPAPGGVLGDMAQLQQWARTSAADLALAEALLGSPLELDQSLGDLLPVLVGSDVHGQPMLVWPPNEDTGAKLEAAIKAAGDASPRMLTTARAAASAAEDECSSAATLKDLLAPRTGTPLSAPGTGSASQLLAAITAAARFPRLQEDVAAAELQRERWERKAEAAASLDSVMEAARSPGQNGSLQPFSQQSGQAGSGEDFAARMAMLESAIDHAREAGISVSRAKKLLKDMQAQATAASAAARLREVELIKAEAAAAAAAGSSVTSEAAMGLQPAIAEAKRQQEVEKAAEALARALAGAKGLQDLPRLEAAILAARKAGAHEADIDTYRTASALRGTLEAAAKGRAAMEAALKALAKNGRLEDADGVEAAATAAERIEGNLLEDDIASTRGTVSSWRAATAAEARLEKLLREGSTPASLSRIIQEAATAGVKVGEARRVLKLLQGLEAALANTGEGQHALLKAKLDAALAGGVASPLLRQAHITLERLQLTQVKTLLEAALNPRHDPTSDRSDALREALDRAEPLLSHLPTPLSSSECHTPNGAGTNASVPSAHLRIAAHSGQGTPAGESEASATRLAKAVTSMEQHLAKQQHVTTPRADSASSIFAIEARNSHAADSSSSAPSESGDQGPAMADGPARGEGLLVDEGRGADLAAVRLLVEEARRRLEAQARDQERITAERNESIAARREQQRIEKEQRERERAQRAAADKLERERLEREKAEKRAERARAVREQQAQAEHARREQAVMERLERERDAAAAAESAAAAFEAAQSRPGSRSELLHPAGAAHSILSPDHPTLSLPSPRGAHHTHGAGSSGPRGIDPAVLEAAMQEWRSAQASSNSTAAGDKAQARSLATMDSLASSASSSSTPGGPWGVPAAGATAQQASAPAGGSSAAEDLMRIATPRLKYDHDLGGATWGVGEYMPTPRSLQVAKPSVAVEHTLLPHHPFAPAASGIGAEDAGIASRMTHATPNAGLSAWTTAPQDSPLARRIDTSFSRNSWGASGTYTVPQASPRAISLARLTGKGVQPGGLVAGPRSMASDPPPLAISVQRPCRFFQQGYCRDGANCRFAHVAPAQRLAPPALEPVSAIHSLHSPAISSMHAVPQGDGLSPHAMAQNALSKTTVGGFSYGAPGSVAFSSGLDQASLTELAPAASQAHHGPSLVSRMAAAAQELEQQGPLPPRSSFRQHLGRHTAFPPQGLAPVHEQPRSHTLAGDWPSSASYEAMGANGPSTAAGAAFHVDWSIPEELGPGPGGQQQSQEVAVGSTHLSQAAPFPHDPLGPSIWQAHAPSAAAASGGFTSAAFELPLLRQAAPPSSSVPVPTKAASSELKASAAEFVPWDASTRAPSSGQSWSVGPALGEQPLLSLPSDLSVSPVAVVGGLHPPPPQTPCTPRGDGQEPAHPPLARASSSGEEHFDVVNRLLQ